MKYLILMVLLTLPITAQADWSGAQLQPIAGPVFTSQQRIESQRSVQSQQRIEPQRRVEATPRHVEPQHRVQAQQPLEHHPVPVINRPQVQHHNESVIHRQDKDRHFPGYFQRDVRYYQDIEVPMPYADVESGFVVPNGFESISVDGQTYYYNNGIFYQEINGQLTSIPPVLDAVVDYIPRDYQIIMADGAHYLFTQGVYYQRVDQGFQVVLPPTSDQE